MSQGLLCVFEGPDGAGKSTQVKLLAEHFKAQGREVLVSREPGGTPLGEKIRSLLLDDEDMSALTEMCLFFAARSQLLETVIRPALQAGQVVILDRFYYSTLVYQGLAGDVGESQVQKMIEVVVGDSHPDYVFFIDVPIDVTQARFSDQPDRMESKGTEFLEKVRQGFLECARQESNLPIDGTQPIEAVHQQVLERLEQA